jgi:8-oxo-dGTP diphosphatase
MAGEWPSGGMHRWPAAMIARLARPVLQMPYTPIVATLGYVRSPDRRRVLLVHRNARPDDQHLGKYNGLGGKIERDEDVVAGMRREIFEEAGIACTTLSLRGTISWPGFGKNGEDWLGFIFVIDTFSGEPFTQNPEGTLEWVDVERIFELPLWDGDRQFLPLVFDDDPRAFHGVMPYRDGSMVSWSYSRI